MCTAATYQTKDFYFGYLGYFYNAGLLCYGKASVNQF